MPRIRNIRNPLFFVHNQIVDDIANYPLPPAKQDALANSSIRPRNSCARANRCSPSTRRHRCAARRDHRVAPQSYGRSIAAPQVRTN